MVAFIFALLLAILVNLPIGYVAIKKDALTMPGGFLSAALTGALVFLAHPLLWGLLVLFFVSSTLLTKFKEDSEVKINAMSYAEKGGQRDSLQVFANGGVAVIGAILGLISLGYFSEKITSAIFLFVAISFSSSNSDTWATEIGTTSNNEPVWVFSWRKRVPRGTSGGITLRGTFGSFLGALVTGILYLFLGISISSLGDLLLPTVFIVIFGFLGSITDTMLGAGVQRLNKCPSCEKLTEKSQHTHDQPVETEYYRGWKWMTNDTVNFLSGLIVSILGFTLYSIL